MKAGLNINSAFDNEAKRKKAELTNPDGREFLVRFSKALANGGVTRGYNDLQIDNNHIGHNHNVAHFVTEGSANGATSFFINVQEGLYTIFHSPYEGGRQTMTQKDIESVTGATNSHNQFMDVLGYICARHYLSGPDDQKRQKLEQIINRFKIDSEPEVSPESTPG